MKVIAYVTDLFFQARIAETAKQGGADLIIVNSLYKFLPEIAKQPEMVIIDLDAEGISGPALISQIKETNGEIVVIAYGAHVQEETLQQATRSGADQVMVRSKFTKALPGLLTQAESKKSSSSSTRKKKSTAKSTSSKTTRKKGSKKSTGTQAKSKAPKKKAASKKTRKTSRKTSRAKAKS